MKSLKNIDGLKGEGYSLKSDKDGVLIEGNSTQGTFYGMQTLIQLLPVGKSKQSKNCFSNGKRRTSFCLQRLDAGCKSSFFSGFIR